MVQEECGRGDGTDARDEQWQVNDAMGWEAVRGEETYLFLFIALLAQILATSGHLGAAHGMFFCCEVLLRLRFCTMTD